MYITETFTTGKPARFYCNGKRIGRAEWQALMDRAYEVGALYGLSTSAKTLPGGVIKRRNFSVISYTPQR